MAGFFEAAANFDADSSPLRELVASSNDIGRADNDGMTLLHYACREGHLEAVMILVEAGVALEGQDRDARTPLHLACLMAGKGQSRGRGHVDIAAYLQQQGAATSTQDKYGHTPLSYMPFRSKCVGLNTPSVDGSGAVWAVEEILKGGAVLKGSVAQSSVVHVLRN